MKRFSLVLRSVSSSTPVEQYAEKIEKLVKKPSVSPVLEHYYPGVMERYTDSQSGAEALHRMAEKHSRKEAAAYLLVLTTKSQHRDIRESYNAAFNINNATARGLGVELHEGSPETHERLVGVGTAIGGQTLRGVSELLRPGTWQDAYWWTNLAIWLDQSATYDVQRRFAECLTDISPDDSFITIEAPHRTTNGSTLTDPNTAFDRTHDFSPHPTARPKGTRRSKADGIATERSFATYLRRSSKVQKRLSKHSA